MYLCNASTINMKSLKQKSCKLKVKSRSKNVEGNVVIGYQWFFLPANYNLPRITFFLSVFLCLITISTFLSYYFLLILDTQMISFFLIYNLIRKFNQSLLKVIF